MLEANGEREIACVCAHRSELEEESWGGLPHWPWMCEMPSGPGDCTIDQHVGVLSSLSIRGLLTTTHFQNGSNQWKWLNDPHTTQMLWIALAEWIYLCGLWSTVWLIGHSRGYLSSLRIDIVSNRSFVFMNYTPSESVNLCLCSLGAAKDRVCMIDRQYMSHFPLFTPHRL